jgi:hypothetical protein
VPIGQIVFGHQQLASDCFGVFQDHRGFVMQFFLDEAEQKV